MMDCQTASSVTHQLTGGPMLYSGIDLHKRLIVICTVNSEGTVVARARMKTDSDAVVTYFRQWTDAHTLAQLLCMGFVPEAHQLPPEYRAMRDLLRQRMVMEYKRTNLMIRTQRSLARSLPKNLLGSSTTLLTRQRPFETFKGIRVTKRHDLPRTCKPVRLTGDRITPPHV